MTTNRMSPPSTTHPEREGITLPYQDKRVDSYIIALPPWQQDICRQVRDLGHAADPDVTEEIKRTVQPYFVLDGNTCALLAAKDHVNVFLYDGAIVPDPEGIITAGHHNKTARTVAIRQAEAIPAAALTAIFQQIIANNRACGWRSSNEGPRRHHCAQGGTTCEPPGVTSSPGCDGHEACCQLERR